MEGTLREAQAIPQPRSGGGPIGSTSKITDEAALTQHVASLVRSARSAAGLTQHELAARMGSYLSVVSHIEDALHLPSVPMLQRIAHATGQSMEISFSSEGTARP
ncbi:MAG: helix-turn-helix transcriptional regulator [Candidatus Nanopelagicales bacterium]